MLNSHLPFIRIPLTSVRYIMTPCIVGINLNNTNTIISEILYQNID